MFQRHRVLYVLAALFFLIPGVLRAQTAYTSIVIFGDSLSDTGNDAAVSKAYFTVAAQVPGAASNYADGRFTDGPATLPAAVNYQGVWIEQLAGMLSSKPAVLNSLAGGTNYAYGYATTNTGTSSFVYPPPNSALAFPVKNMGQQLSDYLATKPTITNKTLFVVWGGANDLLNATGATDIINAATREAGIVQTLIANGATEIMVVNLPPLGLTPRFNASAATSVPATAAAQGYNQALAAGLAQIAASAPTVHLYQLDTYTLFNTTVGPPMAAGLVNVTASSQGNTAVNPDTYLFWDDLHPTTYGHRILANAAYTLLGPAVATTTTLKSSNSGSNLNQSVTFTATVTTTSTTPIGTVTFYDGTTALGSSLIFGTGTTATATYTTSTLTAGPHTISAKFAGVNGYGASTSANATQTVTAPALTAAFSPSTLTLPSQGLGFATLMLSPVGGFTGTATIACGTLPAHFTCTIGTPTVTLKGDNTQQSVMISIGTVTPNARPGSGALAALPALGLLAFVALRRRKLTKAGIALMLVLSLGGFAAMTGCSGYPANVAAPGSYTVPVTVTSGSTVANATLAVTVQQ